MDNSKEQARAVEEGVEKAFDAAFDAMSQWRDAIKGSTERFGETAFKKLGEAAKAAGWPDSLIETTKSQLLQASKLQTDIIDHMMTAWRAQLKAPASPVAFQGTLDQTAPEPTRELTGLALAPTQFWMQATAAWQKSWTDAMAAWMGQKPKDR